MNSACVKSKYSETINSIAFVLSFLEGLLHSDKYIHLNFYVCWSCNPANHENKFLQFLCL